ncbi:MAG TPA: hypothetical protein VLT33_19220 [Labilithrix sp.]|nr:hypothetical protein [Labilithrix sp.]
MCAARLTIAAILASAHAHAELGNTRSPRRPFFATTKAGGPYEDDVPAPAPEPIASGPPGPGVASLWLLPVFWVGLPAPGSLLPRTLMEPLASPALGDDFSLCLGARCPAAWTVLRPDGDPKTYGSAASARVVASLGAVGAAALSLFSNPTPKRLGSLALRPAPMFACGGAGLEMRAAWW